MFKEKILAVGELNLKLVDRFGNVILDRDEENLVVTTGLGFVTSRLIGTASAVMSHMAVGTGAVAPAAANTTLGTELARVALSSSNQTTNTLTNDSVTYVATFPAGTGTGAITEAGILNAASAGTLLNRVTFSVINKAAADALTITWRITFA